MGSLFEKYRPKTLDDVVGQPKACELIRRLAENGTLAGRAYWIAGKSGTGKTTLAKIIAGMVADDINVTEESARLLTPASVRDLERDLHTYGLGSKSGRVVIINEAHGMRKDTVEYLLDVLERIPSHVCWIFTTTLDGQDSLFDDLADAHPLLSRCLPVPMAQRDVAKPMAGRLLVIAQSEGLDGKPIEAYVRLVNDCKGNMREALQLIERGEMFGGAK